MDEPNNGWGRRGAMLGIAGWALALAGCGRRSAPKVPEDSTFHLPYPTRSSMGLPKEDPLHSPPVEDTEDEAPPTLGPLSPPSRY